MTHLLDGAPDLQALNMKWQLPDQATKSESGVIVAPADPGEESELWKYPLTDVGNAERMVSLHRERIRYCHAWQTWLVYDGVRWRCDDNGEITRLAERTLRLMFEEAGRVTDRTVRDERWKFARQSEKLPRIKAMIELATAAAGVSVRPNDLDSDRWQLNVKNGTIDLKTGRLQPHNPNDLISKLAPVNFDPDAPCPAWLSFQHRVTDGEPDLIAFKRRIYGYALTGVVSEKRSLYLFCGAGNNGKTTEIEAFRAVLGDYAGQVRIEALMDQSKASGSSASPDVADLCGLRFAVSSEPAEGHRLAENLIKYLTSMGTVKARQLHQAYFEFPQTWKFVMDCNQKPVIRGTDPAIWNRIVVVPFDVVIPDHEIDRDLPRKLSVEFEGILAWAVQGCLDWRNEGLQPPGTVQRATSEYRVEMDAILRFVEDSCVVSSNASARGADLYSTYRKWCEDTGERPVSNKAFGLQIGARRGISKARDNKGARYDGIGLREEPD